MSDVMLIVALTLGCCLVVAGVGAALLFGLRGHSLRYQLGVAALLPVVAVAGTVLVNVRLMFLSGHDTEVILLSVGVSTVMALVGAWWVMARVTAATRSLGRGLDLLVADSVASPVRPGADAPPEPVAPAEFARLVSDLSETRETLADARAREWAAEDARRELVAFMSHDLRTPLAGLRALTEALEDGVITDVPRALGHLRSTVTRMAGLVDDLFALSRVQSPAESKPQSLVSLVELLTDVASEVDPTARARGVELAVRVPTDDRLAVMGVADDLARALSNLVANAVRHTESGERVELVGARAEDGHVQVTVDDRCGGIPPEHLGRVFDTGWRGTPSRSGDDGGAGLGLAITRGVVESHDGRIAVRNVIGGCRFEVDLPAGAVR